MTERKLNYRRVKCYPGNGSRGHGQFIQAGYRVSLDGKLIDSFLYKKNMLKTYPGIKERP
jgi:hypothetical protein